MFTILHLSSVKSELAGDNASKCRGNGGRGRSGR
jgi:hypothetical protein